MPFFEIVRFNQLYTKIISDIWMRFEQRLEYTIESLRLEWEGMENPNSPVRGGQSHRENEV